MITRDIAKQVLRLSKKYPVTAIMGPRQSGKTTLTRMIFPNKAYASLEDLETREFAQKDPRAFLSHYSKGCIIDEVQRVPSLLSYIQTYVDKYPKKTGLFILTGSQNILMLEGISQSLAGRIALFKLLPLSIAELSHSKYKIKDLEDVLWNGMYPRLYNKKLKPHEIYPYYIQTYIERDVRLIKNITDLGAFHRFLKLCAGHIGQIVNVSSLGNDCGITHNTAKAWLSILESSYIIFLIQPHYKNFKKRLVKMPKLYFYDTGLACSLLGIHAKEQVSTHYLKGGLFESFVFSEMIKTRFNRGIEHQYYFWRDKTGNEIDCIYEKGATLIPVEIKSGKTINNYFFKGINFFNKLSGNSPKNSFLVYGGTNNQVRSSCTILSWKNIHELF
ncbi:MAG: ATP-binding protein [bacterium]